MEKNLWIKCGTLEREGQGGMKSSSLKIIFESFEAIYSCILKFGVKYESQEIQIQISPIQGKICGYLC